MKSRILLILVILSGVFYTYSLQQLISNEHLGKTEMRIPDLKFIPEGPYIRQFLTEIDPYGRVEYRDQLAHEDIIYPIAYTLFFSLLLSYFIQRLFAKRKWLYLLSLFFVIGMVFDWFENSIMIEIIDAWPKEILDYYTMYGIASGVKWTSLGLGMLSLGVLTLLVVKNRLFQSNTRS